MTIYNAIILALWLAFAATWAISARWTRRSRNSGRTWWREIALRLVLVVVVVLAIHFLHLNDALRGARFYAVNRNLVAGLAGAALCAVGVGLAMTARYYLGRNWGMPMSRKENPELVVTGPYATIRHPIYTGLLLAMTGSALGLSIFWILPLLVAWPYLIYSARQEEKYLLAEFPDQYPAYMKRTKMLLPWLL
jgi:protein-S-isoprenylcysteine O-methyltransferase Ste14